MKLTIYVTRERALINKLFDDMEKDDQSKIATLQYRVVKAIYSQKLNLLFNIMRKRVGRWIVRESDDFFIAEQTGEEEEIRQEYERLKKFLEGNEKQLKDDPNYQQYKNDRWVNKVLSYMRSRGTAAKDYAMEKALGSNKVIDFFTRAGLTVKYELKVA